MLRGDSAVLRYCFQTAAALLGFWRNCKLCSLRKLATARARRWVNGWRKLAVTGLCAVKGPVADRR